VIGSILRAAFYKETHSARPSSNFTGILRPIDPSLKENTLNTTELIDAVAAANDLSKAKAKDVVTSVFASILDAAKRGEETSVNGFGRFAVKERPAREGRNPRTGETLKIAASKSLGFKMSKPVGATL
jgi:DNA-binding protein HU-beta